MKELLDPLEREHKHLVAELPALEELVEAIDTQAEKLDAIEKEAAAILETLKRLSS